jgi:hypothetical protein
MRGRVPGPIGEAVRRVVRATMTDGSNNRMEVLGRVLADIERERDRVRDARASFTALLGPLPGSAGVVTGIIASAAGRVDWQYVAATGFVLALIVIVSVRFMGLKPYRELRGAEQAAFDPGWDRRSVAFRAGEVDPVVWLTAKIRLESEIYGDPGDRRYRWWPSPRPTTLTQGLNSERAAANIVQGLVVVIFVLLIIGIAIKA